MTDIACDRVILGGRVIDPESQLDAVRNIGLSGGRVAVITSNAINGRDAIDARGLVVAPGFIDLHSHGTTAETYRMQSLDGVTTTLELELGTSDVDAWYRERSGGQRINYGVSVGHIKVRMAVMRDSGDWMPVDNGAYGVASAAQVREIIESGTWQLRHPVGPDALPFLGWRKSMTDEEWVDLNAADDDTWYTRVEHDFGMAVRPTS